MHVQVEHRPAYMFGGPIVLEPTWVRNHPPKTASLEFSILATLDGLEGPLVFGKEGEHVTDQDHAVSTLGGSNHLLAVGGGERKWFFAKGRACQL